MAAEGCHDVKKEEKFLYMINKNKYDDNVMYSDNIECMSADLDKTADDVVELLKNRGLHIASAESCTGGLISEKITSVSGASEVFELGLCTYSERIKSELLGVPSETIERCGVVSDEVALAMVRGLKQRSGADICVSVTGIAGPSGYTDEMPVGTVYIGFDICGRQFVKLPELWTLRDRSRENIRRSAACYALKVVEGALTEARNCQ